ncbi:DUF2752 domain-containing protein [Mycobacterium deserti]|uniref:DUF2752 domain-containing protein n=1 Tax=Mycobacterium deserti TaxID=2978347 RepID=A0ABT2M752_9MYCO|nr:DUF2752 domain-containing protein [Mycobacterium deserti]MCT7658067.1 DUF2752 domain-containing protein [Mycobacterium deserti]
MHVAHRLAAPMGVAAVAAGGCAVVWLANPTVPGGILPVCPTQTLLGIACPGCGSLRMIYSLLHLDVAAAARYNALGLVAVLLLVWSFGAWTYGRSTGTQVRSWQHLRWSAPVALVLTLAWFVVRNLGFEPFVALHV